MYHQSQTGSVGDRLCLWPSNPVSSPDPSLCVSPKFSQPPRVRLVNASNYSWQSGEVRASLPQRPHLLGAVAIFLSLHPAASSICAPMVHPVREEQRGARPWSLYHELDHSIPVIPQQTKLVLLATANITAPSTGLLRVEKKCLSRRPHT
jgi:hypothetical protein